MVLMAVETKITEQSSINVGLLSAMIAGAFASFLVIAGAIFWGGLLQAKAAAHSEKIAKLEATSEQYRLDMEKVRLSLQRLEIKAGTLPPEER